MVCVCAGVLEKSVFQLSLSKPGVLSPCWIVVQKRRVSNTSEFFDVVFRIRSLDNREELQVLIVPFSSFYLTLHTEDTMDRPSEQP